MHENMVQVIMIILRYYCVDTKILEKNISVIDEI